MHFPQRHPLLPTTGSAPNRVAAATISASQVTEPIDMTAVLHWSIYSAWNAGAGTLAGTITWEVTNVKNPDTTFSSADWVPLTSSVSGTVTSGAGNLMMRGGPDAFLWLRVKFTYSSGTGALVHEYCGRGWQ